MKRKLLRTEFSPKGFWKGLPAVKRLAKEAGVPEDDTKLWLMKQATWKIYLHIPGPTFGVVDVTSRFKVSRAFQKISKRGPLRWPKVLQVDVTREMTKHDVRIRRGNVNNSIELWVNASSLPTTVKRWEGNRSTEWVKRPSEVVSGLNCEVTRLTGKRPIDAINEKLVDAES